MSFGNLLYSNRRWFWSIYKYRMNQKCGSYTDVCFTLNIEQVSLEKAAMQSSTTPERQSGRCCRRTYSAFKCLQVLPEILNDDMLESYQAFVNHCLEYQGSWMHTKLTINWSFLTVSTADVVCIQQASTYDSAQFSQDLSNCKAFALSAERSAWPNQFEDWVSFLTKIRTWGYCGECGD